MKITRIIMLAAGFIMVTTVACRDEFLEVAPAASLSESELASRNGLEGTLIGAYSQLLGKNGFYSDASNWFWGSVLGMEANKGSDPGDQSQVNEIQLYDVQVNNGSVLEKYRATFEGVARANAVLKLIPQTEGVDEATLNRIAGEARFLRGNYYFDLKRNFNNVPYIDETWDEVTPVANDQDLWPFIEADFQFAFENLPETQGQAGRANKWAAAAYLGKTFLFQEKWADAKRMFDQVIASGVNANGDKYRLLDDYAALFRSTNDNNAETVFSVQAAAGTGSIDNANPALVLNFPHGSSGPERPGGCCGFNQPSFDLANSFRTTAAGLPLLDDSYNSPANRLDTDQGLGSGDAFTPDQGPVDPRLDHSIGRRGIPYLDWGPHPGRDWIRNQPNGGPYSPKKFVYYKAGIGIENDGSSWTPGYTALNYYVMRYADVLLMAAEAEAQLGNLQQATELVNQVRERADNAPVLTEDGDPAANYVVSPYGTFGSNEQALEAIYFERKLELSGEGHRKYDLVRWGIAAEEINRILANEKQYLADAYAGATFEAGKDEYLPIPLFELDLQNEGENIVLTQNPGY
ncbi:MAG: RagB/SusD family nutrient uptake outer membrane protein [Tunicatimonas sp.]